MKIEDLGTLSELHQKREVLKRFFDFEHESLIVTFPASRVDIEIKKGSPEFQAILSAVASVAGAESATVDGALENMGVVLASR